MKTAFLQELFSVLNKECNYVVLRNHEGLPYSYSSRDIDILILSKHFNLFKKHLLKLLEQFSLKVLLISRQQDCFGILLKPEDDDSFQIDFLLNTDILGVSFLSTNEILSKRIFNNYVYHLPIGLSLAIKAIYCYALGHDIPERYLNAYNSISSSEKMECDNILARFGYKIGGHYSRLLLYKRMIVNCTKHPISSSFCFFFASCLRLKRFFHPQGILISFSGPDGCGKTTVIDLLCDKLRVNPPVLYHFRPSLFPNLGEVAYKAKIINEVDRNFDKPHRGKNQGILFSLLRLLYYFSDYVIGYYIKIRKLLQQKRIVFFDRYYSDIIADSERSRIFLSYKFLSFLRHFIPSCHYYFFFRVDPKVITNRKQELTIDDINKIYTRLIYLANHDRKCYWIDNNGKPEDAVNQILDIITSKQHSKYINVLK